MAGWQDLPTELILQIVPSLDQRSLAAMSVVSHLLRAASEPYLYELLELGGLRWTEMSSSSQRAKRCDAVRHLIRTLVQRPELCSYVRSLKIGDWKYSSVFSLEDHAKLFNELNSAAPNAEEAQLVLSRKSYEEYAIFDWTVGAASGAGMSTGWLYTQEEPFWGLVILLLHHLPSLNSIDLTELGSALILSEVARGLISGGVPKCLATVATLAILPPVQGTDPHRDDNSNTLAGLALSLPNLANLCISGVCVTVPVADIESNPIPPTIIGSIRHIEFRRCSHIYPTNLGDLREFLRMFVNLESFAFTEEDVGKQVDREGYFHCLGLAMALDLHTANLTALEISCGVHSDGRTAHVKLVQPVGSLQNFTVLQHIKIRVDFFDFSIGRETLSPLDKSRLSSKLPPSLVTLCLILPDTFGLLYFMDVTGCPSDWDQERLHFPALEKFTILHSTRHGDVDTLDAEALSAFARANIVLLPPIVATESQGHRRVGSDIDMAETLEFMLPPPVRTAAEARAHRLRTLQSSLSQIERGGG